MRRRSQSERGRPSRRPSERPHATASSGNVFRDLGFSREEAAHLLVRADLLIQVQKAVALRGLNQAEGAKTLRVSQPRVSEILRGRIDLFSTDALIDMLARLGAGVRLMVKLPVVADIFDRTVTPGGFSG